MRVKFFWIVLVPLILLACNFNRNEDDREPIARVNNNYLYLEDLADVVPKGTTVEDSMVLVNGFIDRWATKQLLVDGAERNLTEETVEEFSKLVEEYRYDLYTKAYLEALVAQRIDTSVSQAEAERVYNANSESFKLNEELIKFRYINIPKNAVNLSEVQERFKRFDSTDREVLDSISIQFKSFSLKDSIWIKVSQVVQKIPVLNADNKKELLKKSNFIQLQDSLDLYLMQINDVLLSNEYAPLEYVKPTIDQIVINKRKLELIKQLEKEITEDAVKNNQFETFNK